MAHNSCYLVNECCKEVVIAVHLNLTVTLRKSLPPPHITSGSCRTKGIDFANLPRDRVTHEYWVDCL